MEDNGKNLSHEKKKLMSNKASANSTVKSQLQYILIKKEHIICIKCILASFFKEITLQQQKKNKEQYRKLI